MKHIKTYKVFENNNFDLISELKKYSIENYTINEDGSIDVNGNVYITNENLMKIPFKFSKINENFAIYNNQLISLEGCPKKVGGSFNCVNNKLEGLEGCSTEVGDNFSCTYNKLESLEYCPLEIGGDFSCSYNNLTMLDCSSYVKGNIYCNGMFAEEPEFFGDCEGKILWEL